MKIRKETTTPKQQEQQQEQLQEHQQQSPATNGIKQPPFSDTSRASAALSSASPSSPTRRLRVSLSVHCGSTPDSVTTILPYPSCQDIILTCSKRTTPPLALGETSIHATRDEPLREGLPVRAGVRSNVCGTASDGKRKATTRKART